MSAITDYASIQAQARAVARRSRARKWMRKLPTRHNIERYPILKYWGKSAKLRPYLWSWRRPHTTRAIYVGWIITLLPLGGAQLLLAAIFSVLFKANLTVAAALQFVSNPITAAPIYLATYVIGKQCLKLAGALPEHLISGTAASLMVGGVLVGLLCGFLTDLLRRVMVPVSHRPKRAG